MMKTHTIPVIVIAGPTGVGKTEISLTLAKEFNGEIINGDSLQVYRDLTIGTGKILPSEMQGIPHHLLDILEPHEDYNAHQFKEMATARIIDINERGGLPIVVGGTGLYLEGLLYDLEFGQVEDPRIRERLEEELKDMGPLALWERLAQLDPKASEKIPYQNSRRTVRALEVIEASGQLFSEQTSHQEKRSVYDELLFVLDRPREKLYQRINQRVIMMMDQGLEEEATALIQQAQGANWQSLQGIGYKEWLPYLEGAMSEEKVIQSIQKNSRRYAKRQLTWFRNRMKEPHWINMENEDAPQTMMQLIANHLGGH